MFGILNLNKPVGCTSRDAVNRVQRLIRPVKVGHAGTLDPLAQGVLVLCVGPATRLIEKVQQMPKHYQGTFRLGCHSPTDDTEDEVQYLANAISPTRAAIEAVLGQFVGRIHQQPPAYSAIKVGGKRAYHLARQGKTVTLHSRPVTIHALSIDRYEYPELVLDIDCGSGTYIRSLGRDLAKAVDTAAVMTGLTRTTIGPYAIENALAPQTLTRNLLIKRLQSPLTALGKMPRVFLTAPQVNDIQHGRLISIEPTISADPMGDCVSHGLDPRFETAAEIAAVDTGGHLIALLAPKPGNRWGPIRNFPPPAS
jgi:tRNA pseudouridine55 synthase